MSGIVREKSASVSVDRKEIAAAWRVLQALRGHIYFNTETGEGWVVRGLTLTSSQLADIEYGWRALQSVLDGSKPK